MEVPSVLPGSKRTIAADNELDLTHTLSPTFPIWPCSATFPIIITNGTTVAKDDYYANKWELLEHHGTHLDATAHFLQEGVTTERLEAPSLIVPVAVIEANQVFVYREVRSSEPLAPSRPRRLHGETQDVEQHRHRSLAPRSPRLGPPA
jgi:kynurenine formamidase